VATGMYTYFYLMYDYGAFLTASLTSMVALLFWAGSTFALKRLRENPKVPLV
jgi:hypothetical protein